MDNTGVKSFRKQDSKAEKQLAAFMDKYFYSRLDTEYKRVTDPEMQLKGVDVIIGSDSVKIDEKASLYYSNVMIPTFVFELDFMSGNNCHTGWYLNENLLTDYYMLIWPNIRDLYDNSLKKWVRKDVSEIMVNDFTIVEAMLVEKKKINAEFERRMLTAERLLAYVRAIRMAADKSRYRDGYRLDDDIKIMLSDKLNEKPINLVVNKKLLYDVADRVYLISQDGFANVKR